MCSTPRGYIYMLYIHHHNQLIMTTSITNEYTSLYKSITLYFRKGDVCCVWEMSGDKDWLLYWPKFFLDHSSTSSSSWLGLLNCGSLRASKPSFSSWFSLWHPVSNWLKPPRHWVILFSMPTCFLCSSIYLHRCIFWLTTRPRVNIYHIYIYINIYI